MGQCVVMPELDGVLYPYVLIAQSKNRDGMYVFKTIPNRLQKFISIINNYISLKKKNNGEKKIAVYYFKREGNQNLNAQGMEATASLYHVLKR